MPNSVGVWRALLIVYSRLDLRLSAGRLGKRRYRHELTEEEIRDATGSFKAFPSLVARLTSGAAAVKPQIVAADSPLNSLTRETGQSYWPSPDDTRGQLDSLAPPGSYESIFILWPQHDSNTGSSILCRGWGLGMAASPWSNGATYAVVGNAPSGAWEGEAHGEVWLHEWLHGVCHYFATQGHEMPSRDADGADTHGYLRSSTEGWTEYYRDLMTGNVSEGGKSVGIPLVAWQQEARPGTFVAAE